MGNDIIVLIVVEAFAVIAMSLKINLSCVLVKFTAEFTAFLRKVLINEGAVTFMVLETY